MDHTLIPGVTVKRFREIIWVSQPQNGGPCHVTQVRSCLHQGLSLKSRQKSLRSRHREDRLSKAIETELLGTEQAVAGIT